MSFKVGDTVRLKSSGPVMTVAYQTQSGDFECVWFPGVDTEPKRFTFKPDMLKLVDMR